MADIYQSPMPTGQTAGTTTYEEPPAQQPAMATNEKQEYYTAAQPVEQMQQQPMQQAPVQQMQTQPSMYQNAVPLHSLTEAAAPIDCPTCRQRGLTRVEFVAGNTTHVWALVLCVCIGLGCVPYLINGLKDVNHKCGNCGVFLATWKKSGRTVVHAHG
ncbi:hypothetical protein OEA41_001978 [Lepraria neglecta]|uniref:LITAF domain-containing protein n=1 Tax=Lepraria neglecta TaxID=209136 RepID=A0AAD9ZE56_9LECA|nr:hypothetical protein OEA41_001978 [Lepraria neglecta]